MIKKIWLNTRSHLSAILTDLKKLTWKKIKKWGRGRFRRSGGTITSFMFYEA